MNDFRLQSDALIIGSGIAGCMAALTLADQGCDVIIITAGPDLMVGNTATGPRRHSLPQRGR